MNGHVRVKEKMLAFPTPLPLKVAPSSRGIFMVSGGMHEGSNHLASELCESEDKCSHCLQGALQSSAGNVYKVYM